jgi:integrase
MASISTGADGRRRILFVAADGRRKTIRLGKASLRVADEVKRRVEALQACAAAGVSWDAELARWIGDISADLAGKLATVGLITPRKQAEPRSTLLGTFIDAYIAKRRAAGAKPNTLKNLEAGRRLLVGFFATDRELATITPADADDFKLSLQGQGYAKATIGRGLKYAKHFFRIAVRAKHISENPFADVKSPGQANEERKFFVSRDVIAAVLEKCPDAEWRLIVALSRYAGLRCPTEHLGLKWAGVDWERARFLVTAPKTEHHEGNGERWVPIFPELRPYLQDAFELAAEGAVNVISRYRDTNQNLRTQLLRIIKRAGLRPWPRLFHNLRASRETELAANHPIHVVCQWLGNSALIAQKHYLQVTEEDFARAAQNPTRAAQNPAQYGAESGRTEPQREDENLEKAANCGSTRDEAVLCGTGEYAWRESNPQPSDP